MFSIGRQITELSSVFSHEKYLKISWLSVEINYLQSAYTLTDIILNTVKKKKKKKTLNFDTWIWLILQKFQNRKMDNKWFKSMNGVFAGKLQLYHTWVLSSFFLLDLLFVVFPKIHFLLKYLITTLTVKFRGSLRGMLTTKIQTHL